MQSAYELLLPYARRNAVNPPAACVGSVSRSLALAAALDGRDDDTARPFEDAVALNEAMGTRPWVGRTRRDYDELIGR